tara:strand:- start:231 stop:587 length:357 start_codon:yes stop_codon:yes gene_type:complete
MSDDKRDASVEQFDEANAAALADMLVDSQTSENVRIQIINELNNADNSNSFFETMFKEQLSLANCPNCLHTNHWLIPEDNLNQYGHVTSQEDSRVKPHTTKDDCPEYQEACAKKKVTA